MLPLHIVCACEYCVKALPSGPPVQNKALVSLVGASTYIKGIAKAELVQSKPVPKRV